MVLRALQQLTFQVEGRPYSDGSGEKRVARRLSFKALEVEQVVDRTAKTVVPVITGFLRSSMAWHDTLVGSLSPGVVQRGGTFRSAPFDAGRAALRLFLKGEGNPRGQTDYYVAKAIYAPSVEAHHGYLSQALGSGFAATYGATALVLPYTQPILTVVRGQAFYTEITRYDYVTLQFSRYLSLMHIWNQTQNAIRFEYPTHSPIQFDSSKGGYREAFASGAARFTPSPVGRSSAGDNVRGGLGLLGFFTGGRR